MRAIHTTNETTSVETKAALTTEYVLLALLSNHTNPLAVIKRIVLKSALHDTRKPMYAAQLLTIARRNNLL